MIMFLLGLIYFFIGFALLVAFAIKMRISLIMEGSLLLMGILMWPLLLIGYFIYKIIK